MIQGFIKKIRVKYSALRNRRIDYLESLVGPPGAWESTRDFQYQFLLDHGLLPYHLILDIGCGPLRGGIPLIRYLNKGGYTGIDIRPKVIREASKEISRNNLSEKNPQLFLSDTFGEKELPDSHYDYIWLFQVLYHLEDSLAEACFKQVARCLKPQGFCYANVNCIFESSRWEEFPYVRKNLSFYESLAQKNDLSIHFLGQLKDYDYPDILKGKANHILELRPLKK